MNRRVQVPDEMRKSAVFLYYAKGGEWYPAGTAFFVAYPIPDYDDRAVGMLMTAHHVIAGIKRIADDGRVRIRVNTTDGGATWTDTDADIWIQAREGLDCSYIVWEPPPEMNVEWRAWHLRSAATKEYIAEEGIGLGDEVFMVGLFRNHLGRDRNEPIVRVGNIAAMPTDPIKTRFYGDMPAILIEARSIGGLSGSPVFVHLGYSRWRQNTVQTWRPESGAGPFVFLGLMHGHWDALAVDVDAVVDADALVPSDERLNMGVGIVVPADEILNAIRPTMEALVQAAKQQLDDGSAPTPDKATSAQEMTRRA